MMSLTKTGMATYAALVGGAWFVYLNQFLFPICFLYANIVIAQAKVRERRQRIQEGARGGHGVMLREEQAGIVVIPFMMN